MIAFSATIVSAAFAEEKNDYFNSDEAQTTIDKIIAAYGGVDRISNQKRMKVEIKMSMNGQKVDVTLYQTPSKIRREISMMGRQMTQTFDGETATIMMGGQNIPAPPQLREELAYQLKTGVGQISFLNKYLNKDSEVRYVGEQDHDGKTYLVIQAANDPSMTVLHYFAPETFREALEITKKPTGDEIQKFDSYRSFKGVLWQEKVTMLGADGTVLGGMELISITNEFDDAVFDSGQ